MIKFPGHAITYPFPGWSHGDDISMYCFRIKISHKVFYLWVGRVERVATSHYNAEKGFQ